MYYRKEAGIILANQVRHAKAAKAVRRDGRWRKRHWGNDKLPIRKEHMT